jgi:ectoine hydroxylase-related dioxygenase (phytanoyl-CoA dioxygenase family)
LLTIDERARLDRDGFLVLEDMLTRSQLDAIAARVDELVVAEGERAGLEVHQEEGTERLSDLVNKGACFDIVWQHPRLLAGIAHVLKNDFRLSSLNYRSPHPGYGEQAFHTDWSGSVAPGDYSVCNSIWCIDDFTADNGATVVVPGSHASGRDVAEMASGAVAHADPVALLASRGSAIIFNAHLWHAGSTNTTAGKRRACHSYWTKRNLPQQLDQRAYITAATHERIGAAGRWLLDVPD